MSGAPRQKKIQDLQQRLARLQAEQRAAEARAKASASKAARANDTRRKVLAGAFLLDLLGASGVAQISVQGRSFSAWLTRPDDRAAFGLPPLAVTPPATPAPPGAGVSAVGAALHAEGGSV